MQSFLRYRIKHQRRYLVHPLLILDIVVFASPDCEDICERVFNLLILEETELGACPFYVYAYLLFDRLEVAEKCPQIVLQFSRISYQFFFVLLNISINIKIHLFQRIYTLSV
eukprot:TRINITY_DN636_c0_g2_i3.p1 TRINITY_DN636_c0_g2~~TRINITY_DN636_c0_g2_i3.p1  ORF type:complete len:112 (-),score=3.67 TRINITY_DN636_c0_g2_i3:229-564(-)